ncbi:MAG: M23 family metallopeptidase [Cyclobacteriaceae bacterium]|nr:M23 family metallopeptidase [Cyclobacteriaceae bacterium]
MTLSRLCILVALPLGALAQFNESDGHSTRGAGSGSYLFPINPGKPNYLAGTMGELRNTHFHGGIDIRTNNRIGVPVLTTQDGYVSRAHISSSGYGTALYVTHPEGKMSVYGHLEKVRGKLGDYVKREQYKHKSFEIDLNFKPTQFPVNKGDTIALSGNTGSSSGPHLHFEIREGNFVLNPLKFGFTEIKDNIPPSAKKIAIRTLDRNSRINDRFGRFEFSLIKKSAEEYVLPVPILAHGRLGIELLADDRMDDSPARCGINYIEMLVDSQRVFSQVIERVDLDETRGVLALMDFKTLEIKGKRFNKLYIDDGNRMDFYKTQNEGIVEVNGKDKSVHVSLKDESGNTSHARFRLKSSPLSDEMILATPKPVTIESDLQENFLIITCKACSASDKLSLYQGGQKTEVPFDYRGANQRVYLIDLQKYQPDSVSTCAGSLLFYFKDVVPSETEYTYYSEWADVRFPENSLYDTLFLNVNHRMEGGEEVFVIGKRTVPLHKNVRVTLKPKNLQHPTKNYSVYRKEGRGYSYVGGEWNSGKVRFYTRELGEFTFATDSMAPTISRIRLDNQSARFKVRDNLSGIAYYEANISGQWLLMAYDFKSGILQSERLDPSQPLKGDFELKVVDRAGNERIFKQKIQ